MMSRSKRNAVNEDIDRDSVGDNGGEHDVDQVSEDIDSMESDDGGDDDYDPEDAYWMSDCESSTSVKKPIVDRTKIQPTDESNNLRSKPGADGLIRLNESEKIHEDIKNSFISAVEAIGVNVQIEHIDRNLFNASAIAQARVRTFRMYNQAMNIKTGGHANIRHAWFGACKEQIQNIILHGFSYDNIEKNGEFGCGLYLTTNNFTIESLKSSTADDNGVRQILVCNVIVGKTEVIEPGSKQSRPSSDEFQTGTDNLEYPKKLIVWSTHLNTYILPEFVLSFKILSGYNEPGIERVRFDQPLSCWMPVKTLVSGLSKVLPPEANKKMNEYHRKYLEHKISKHDMLRVLKGLAGKRLLLTPAEDSNEQGYLYLVKKQQKQAKAIDSKAKEPLDK